MEKRLEQLPKLAEEAKKENKKYFTNLKKRTPKNLDYVMQELHDAEFAKTDCLDCGNCCKTSSPIFIDKDSIYESLEFYPALSIVKETLKKVTLDEDVKIYHLRHSFANYLYLVMNYRGDMLYQNIIFNEIECCYIHKE